MRAFQQRIHQRGEPFHLSGLWALLTACSVIAAVVEVVILFVWAFATRAY